MHVVAVTAHALDSERERALATGMDEYVTKPIELKTLRAVLDRRSDLIVSGGENVYPAEVERVLGEHPQVVEAAVVGERDRDLGQRPVAWLVAREGKLPSGDELRTFCRERLAKFKLPRSIDYTNEMPRDPNGKLFKRKLRDPYWEGVERAI